MRPRHSIALKKNNSAPTSRSNQFVRLPDAKLSPHHQAPEIRDAVVTSDLPSLRPSHYKCRLLRLFIASLMPQ